MASIVSTPARRAIRGAIRVSVSTSRDSVIAGDLFSVFVKVQNPFEVPLGVLDISAFVPVEFYDVEQRRQSLASQAGALAGQVGRGARSLGRLVGLGSGTPPAETGALGHVSARSISSTGAPTDGPELTILQPGNSTTRVFTLCSRHERRFRPGTYRMQISVRYRFDPEDRDASPDEDNADVIDYSLDVRASLSSILLGGAVGASLGWLARHLSSPIRPTGLLAAASWLVHVLLTLGILLLFARKKDVQPLLSVEDTYGGALIGFMIGFTGADAVGSMLQFPGTGAGPGAGAGPTPG